MEIEAKYRVNADLTPQRITSLDLHPYSVRPEKKERHQDLLLDTADRAITGAGYALRIRTAGKRRILTLKGPPLGGAFHHREEDEAELETESTGSKTQRPVRRTRWPEPIKSKVAELIGEEPVTPLFGNAIDRSTWTVQRAGQVVAELAYDVGAITADGGSDRVNELEVELKGDGDMADLRDLDERLRALLPIEPEPRTKLARGLALLPRQRPDPGHRDLRELGKRAIEAALRKYQKREQDARAGEDPEGVHDVRVAVRRLRSALALLEDAPDFDSNVLRRWRRRLKRLAVALGAVRDLDVQLGRLSHYLDAHPEFVSGMEPIRSRMQRERETARAAMLAALDANKTRETLRELQDFVTGEAHHGEDGESVLVRHFAGAAVWRRYEDALRYERLLPTEAALTLHELRIACKRLRYALEMFTRAFGPRAEPLIATLVATQDCLGAHQDCAVARGYLEESSADAKDTLALVAYNEALVAEQFELRAQFWRLWTHLSGRAFRRDLAALIAAL
jgi:triphosphatase